MEKAEQKEAKMEHISCFGADLTRLGIAQWHQSSGLQQQAQCHGAKINK